MIIDSKVLMSAPPPSYSDATAPPPFPGTRGTAMTLATLPPHIQLHVVYSTFPQTPSIDHGKTERQRKTLFWLVNSLRLVNRSFYIACMHVLRSTYLPAYQSFIRPPYTSDPFPTTALSPTYTTSSETQSVQPIQSIQRETTVLDYFIAAKVREDVFLDESELHLEREETFKDLFDHTQPKARLEDLVRKYGLRAGVICVTVPQQSSQQARGSGGGSATASVKSSPAQSASNLTVNVTSTPPLSPLSPSSTASSSPSTPTQSRSSSSTSRFFSSLFSVSPKLPKPSVVPTPYPHSPSAQGAIKFKPIHFDRISISLSPRTISLLVKSGSTKRTLVQTQRDGKNMKLEVGAKKLVAELQAFLISDTLEGPCQF